MAALTPSTLTQHSAGSLNLYIANFTTVDSTDTWDSGLNGVIESWGKSASAPSTYPNAGFNVSESGGVFTMYPGAVDQACVIFILATDG